MKEKKMLLVKECSVKECRKIPREEFLVTIMGKQYQVYLCVQHKDEAMIDEQVQVTYGSVNFTQRGSDNAN